MVSSHRCTPHRPPPRGRYALIAVWVALGVTGMPLSRAAAQSGWQRVDQAAPAGASLPLRMVDAEDVVPLLRRDRGSNVILFLYGPACPRSRALIDFAVRLTREMPERNLVVRAFAVDNRPAEVPAFTRAVGLPHQPFQIRPWAPGGLQAALRPLGLRFGDTFDYPVVAVIDGAGALVDQWEVSNGEVMSTAQALVATVRTLR